MSPKINIKSPLQHLRDLQLIQPKACLVMGVINLHPQSFYRGSIASNASALLELALQMQADGADVIDLGAEPTNPHLNERIISVEEEAAHIVTALDVLKSNISLPLSVDTSAASVMAAAIRAGAAMINDVRGLSWDGALEVIASSTVEVCIMAMSDPLLEGKSIYWSNQEMLENTYQYLKNRAAACEKAGISADRIAVDPGIGGGCFGKSTRQNLFLIAHLSKFLSLNYPLLIGVSRKKFLGEIFKIPPEERLYGSLCSAMIAAQRGAGILRTHDVLPVKQMLTMLTAIDKEEVAYET